MRGRRGRGQAARSVIHEQEAGGVPDLVGEGAGAFHALFGEHDIGAGGGALQQRHADGVGAVLLGDHQRVDHVALGLGHLLPVGVAHQAVDVDRWKGISPMNSQPSMTMRATQKNRMSKPVMSSEVG